VSCVVDCSIIIRLLANKPGDEILRQRLARTVHAPALIDAEVSSVVRGLSITAKPEVHVSTGRARRC
jgi:predicted nucleic acid-binding protein